MVTSNLGHISHGFGARVTYWLIIVSGTYTPPSHLMSSVMLTRNEYVNEPYIAKKLDTLCYPAVKMASFYVHSF